MDLKVTGVKFSLIRRRNVHRYGMEGKGNQLALSLTDLSTADGLVHNHLERERRGCCWIMNGPDEKTSLELLPSDSFSESKEKMKDELGSECSLLCCSVKGNGSDLSKFECSAGLMLLWIWLVRRH